MSASVVAAALGEAAVLVTAAGGDPIESVLCRVRAAASDASESILLIIEPGVAAIDRAMLHGALGPLATELAPGSRINALDVMAGAAADNVIAAASFLATACSTTGQVIVLDA
ncbi:hypothetical protein QH494_18320 [Sphingomonas sp. AR_OL41]|uniref:Rossmann fold domain-containing protein n=1 Tax=Sphingomonas sp. AR_OL41 TaxID=3042729 RepID=UPI002480FD68|nr:hypothetical protein [Sphingomonas sp. AR_OL41]MDH7974148.1 hypothetical protein [Sphingomonas sp. AR_OL41]